MKNINYCTACSKLINEHIHIYPVILSNMSNPTKHPGSVTAFPMTYYRISYINNNILDDYSYEIYYCSKQCFDKGEEYFESSNIEEREAKRRRLM